MPGSIRLCTIFELHHRMGHNPWCYGLFVKWLVWGMEQTSELDFRVTFFCNWLRLAFSWELEVFGKRVTVVLQTLSRIIRHVEVISTVGTSSVRFNLLIYLTVFFLTLVSNWTPDLKFRALSAIPSCVQILGIFALI